MESYYEKVKKIIKPEKVYDLNDKITFAAVPLSKICFKEKDLFYFAKGDGKYSFAAPNKNSDSEWKLLYHALPVMQKPKESNLEKAKRLYPEGTRFISPECGREYTVVFSKDNDKYWDGVNENHDYVCVSTTESGLGEYLLYKGLWANIIKSEKPVSDKKTVLEICKEKYKEGMIVKDACDGKTFKILDKPFFKSILDNIYANDGENSRMLFHSFSGKYAEIISSPSNVITKPTVKQVICTRSNGSFEKGKIYNVEVDGRVYFDDGNICNGLKWDDPDRNIQGLALFEIHDPTVKVDDSEGPCLPKIDMDHILKECTLKYPIGTIILKGNNTVKIMGKPFISSIHPDIIQCMDDRGLYSTLYDDRGYAERLSVPSSTKSNDDRVVGFGAAMMAAQQANSFSSRMEREQMQAWKDGMMQQMQRGYINPYDNKSYFPPLSTLRSSKQEDESNPFLLNKKSKKKLNENIQSPKSITLKIKK